MSSSRKKTSRTSRFNLAKHMERKEREGFYAAVRSAKAVFDDVLGKPRRSRT